MPISHTALSSTDRLQPGAPASSWPRRSELVAIVGFWTVLGTLTVLRRLLDPRAQAGFVSPGVLLALTEYVLWAVVTPFVFALARRWPVDREIGTGRVLRHLGIAAVVAAGIDLVRFVAVRPFVASDIAARPPFASTPGEALLRLQFLDELVIYLAVLAGGFARDFFLRYREREAAAARLEAQLAEARLSALRMQLNPHFLFNTLNAVSALVERDPAGVRRMVARLSSLLRYVLEEGSAPEVPLRDELAFLRSYLAIQEIRFSGRLQVSEACRGDVLDALVPNLILQPLVENAVKHGLGAREDGVGHIEIGAERVGHQLVLTVRDDGPGAHPEDIRDGVGLSNTRARLEALYGSDATLTLESGSEGGLVARVVLPYHTARDLRAVVVEPQSPVLS